MVWHRIWLFHFFLVNIWVQTQNLNTNSSLVKSTTFFCGMFCYFNHVCGMHRNHTMEDVNIILRTPELRSKIFLVFFHSHKRNWHWLFSGIWKRRWRKWCKYLNNNKKIKLSVKINFRILIMAIQVFKWICQILLKDVILTPST